MKKSDIDIPLDVWLRIPEDDNEDGEAESEANCFRDNGGIRVEWYHTAVGLVSSKWFPTHAEARAWLEAEGFQDFSS